MEAHDLAYWLGRHFGVSAAEFGIQRAGKPCAGPALAFREACNEYNFPAAEGLARLFGLEPDDVLDSERDQDSDGDSIPEECEDYISFTGRDLLFSVPNCISLEWLDEWLGARINARDLLKQAERRAKSGCSEESLVRALKEAAAARTRENELGPKSTTFGR